MDVEQIVNGYKSLSRIERSIRTLKSFIKVRPIWHYTDDRVKAHLFICILSYLLEETISHYTGKEPDKVLEGAPQHQDGRYKGW
jgi:transposase